MAARTSAGVAHGLPACSRGAFSWEAAGCRQRLFVFYLPAALRDGEAEDRDFPRPPEGSRCILEFLFVLVVYFGRGIPLSFDRAL